MLSEFLSEGAFTATASDAFYRAALTGAGRVSIILPGCYRGEQVLEICSGQDVPVGILLGGASAGVGIIVV